MIENNNKEILVTRPSIPPFDEYVNEIKSIWDSCWLTNFGSIHNKFEEELKTFLDVDNVSLFTNGHMALYSAIKCLDLTGEIITTPFTFASTTNAILQAGCTPVFCDIDPVTFTINADKIESLITEKTCAILPVHVYGTVCDLEKISQIAKKYNLKVIYDAAHAFGVSISDSKHAGPVGIGNFGDVSMFSFHATKAFNSIEGGCLTFKDSSLAAKLKSFKNFGLIDAENVSMCGTNAKMNEFSAAMGICNLRHIKDVLAKRREICLRYRENLSGIKGLGFLPIQENVITNYAYFPVIFDKNEGCKKSRDEIMSALADQKIHARRYFYPLTSDFPQCKEFSKDSDLPVAKHISESVLSLPLYADLELSDADRICNIIKNNINN